MRLRGAATTIHQSRQRQEAGGRAPRKFGSRYQSWQRKPCSSLRSEKQADHMTQEEWSPLSLTIHAVCVCECVCVGVGEGGCSRFPSLSQLAREGGTACLCLLQRYLVWWSCWSNNYFTVRQHRSSPIFEVCVIQLKCIKMYCQSLPSADI